MSMSQIVVPGNSNHGQKTPDPSYPSITATDNKPLNISQSVSELTNSAEELKSFFNLFSMENGPHHDQKNKEESHESKANVLFLQMYENLMKRFRRKGLHQLKEELGIVKTIYKEELYEIISKDMVDYISLSSKIGDIQNNNIKMISDPVDNLQRLSFYVFAVSTHLVDTLQGLLEYHEAKSTEIINYNRNLEIISSLEQTIQILKYLTEAKGKIMCIEFDWEENNRGERKNFSEHSVHRSHSEEIFETNDESTLMKGSVNIKDHVLMLEKGIQSFVSFLLHRKMLDAQKDESSKEEDENKEKEDFNFPEHLSNLINVDVIERRFLAFLTSTFSMLLSLKDENTTEKNMNKDNFADNNCRKEEPKNGENAINVERKKCVATCLRCYLLLGREQELHEVIRRLLVVPYITTHFTQGKLDGSQRGSCSGLKDILQNTLIHLSKNETLSILLTLNNESEFCTNLNILVECIWEPIQKTLCNTLSSVFAPGLAPLLHQNYCIIICSFLYDLANLGNMNSSFFSSTTLPFSAFNPENEKRVNKTSYDFCLGSSKRYLHLLHHPLTQQIINKWNLPVYFHLIYGEFTSKVDKIISNIESEGWIFFARDNSKTPKSASDFDNQNKINTFYTGTINIFWEDVISRLWHPKIFLQPLAFRFFRFTLQLLNRLNIWLKTSLDANSSNTNKTESSTNSTKWSSSFKESLRTNSFSEAFMVLSDVKTLSDKCKNELLSIVITSTMHLQLKSLSAPSTNLEKLTDREIKLYDEDEDLNNKIISRISDSLETTLAQMHTTLKDYTNNIEKLITNECNTLLLDVRSITATYRMTNRPPPRGYSKFLNNVFDPINTISSAEDIRLTKFIDELNPLWKTNIIKAVIERYNFLINEILQSVVQMEEALQRRKGKGNIITSLYDENMDTNQVSDSDKIRLQLFLDIVKFGEKMEELLQIDSANTFPEYGQLIALLGPSIRARFSDEFLMDRVSNKFVEMIAYL